MISKFLSAALFKSGYHKMTDSELVAVYKQKKDNEIITVLFNRYIHLVFAVCVRYYKQEAKAKDTAMEVFEKLGSKLQKYEVRNFKSWLCTMAGNECLMELRKNKPEIMNIEYVEKTNLHFMDIQGAVHLNSEEKTSLQVLARSLGKLKDNQRVCLEMMYLKNKSYKEIANYLSITEKQVKSHIQNGKRNLRKIIEKGSHG